MSSGFIALALHNIQPPSCEFANLVLLKIVGHTTKNFVNLPSTSSCTSLQLSCSGGQLGIFLVINIAEQAQRGSSEARVKHFGPAGKQLCH